MDWLRTKKKLKTVKKNRSESIDVTVAETLMRNGWWLGWREPWVGHWILESSFTLDRKCNGNMNQITCTVLLYENDFTARFMTACHRIVNFTICVKLNGCFGRSAYTIKENINLHLYTDFSRSNHHDTEWKRNSMWEWCYITWYRTRAELWWGHTER